MRFFDRIRSYMAGRYGSDQLNILLIVVYFIVSMLGTYKGWLPLILVAYVLVAAALYRMFSKNIQKRRQENAVLMKAWYQVKSQFKLLSMRIKEGKTNRFFRCKSCGQIIRVPKGKGQIRITCPKCRRDFVEKT